MVSIITLKRRINSITNTRQITKAMELVSASKLRRAQEYANRSKAYHDMAQNLLIRLSNIKELESQPLFAKREVKKRLYVVITSSSGLAGAYNSNVLKLLTNDLKKFRSSASNNLVITVGTKGAQFVRRLEDAELMAVYPSFGDRPTANDLRPLLNTIVDSYKEAQVDEVRLIYTVFNSTISQTATELLLLPAHKLQGDSENLPTLSNFEPDVESVVNEAVTRLMEAELLQAVVESDASEYAMRMVAMKNATDNAKDLIDDYRLELNTARQAGITQELAEISGGVEALNAVGG